ncbi:hypothetical protein [Streptomyces sp. NPDC052036]|uniref:hypothetical protein n=1 Tax=Streptomyces sp. NPDC052036 TaxID=3155171 RepID=UPI00343B0F9F
MITARRVLTGPDGEGLDDGAVLVRDGIIAAVGPQTVVDQLGADASATLTFPDATVLPGLIDCHTHLIFDASADPVTAFRNSSDDGLWDGMAERSGHGSCSVPE